jgi:hypothetical protein
MVHKRKPPSCNGGGSLRTPLGGTGGSGVRRPLQRTKRCAVPIEESPIISGDTGDHTRWTAPSRLERRHGGPSRSTDSERKLPRPQRGFFGVPSMIDSLEVEVLHPA